MKRCVRSFRPAIVAIAQCGGVLLGLAGLAFAPPAQGRMLLLPVVPGSAQHLAGAALSGEARLLGAGPVAGSLLVIGDRARLGGPVLAAGALMLSAPAILCGRGFGDEKA